ncbi:pre-mRNA-splicing factor 38a [Anaeramoeba ignava]|uniref:Pre-mRNA-splicing factor 38 n=1 Tax=Anaeramoeba ignava TaxID=1746090 RepID=A0A9Q0R8G9_ANAIG|nr:pre-mRNA-splicing factor 38a [Anaeramoeba ignava]
MSIKFAQKFLEKIVLHKIVECRYWKEHCFGLDTKTLLEKAMELDHIGGTYGGIRKPTNFLCLVTKMIELKIPKEITVEFIRNEDFKYVRALGAFYYRLIGEPIDIYIELEKLYSDFRRLKKLTDNGYSLIYVDEFIDELLHSESSCDTSLPRIPKRIRI